MWINLINRVPRAQQRHFSNSFLSIKETKILKKMFLLTTWLVVLKKQAKTFFCSLIKASAFQLSHKRSPLQSTGCLQAGTVAPWK